MMATARGQFIQFAESDVRSMGRAAAGVRGIDLREDDAVVSMDVVQAGDTHVLVTTQKGMGKLTALGDYRSQSRGGLGVLTQRVSERTGPVVAARSVRLSDKLMLMLITERGKVLRTHIHEISEIGRVTQGVKLMNIDNDDEVAGIAIMRGEASPSSAAPGLETADADGQYDAFCYRERLLFSGFGGFALFAFDFAFKVFFGAGGGGLDNLRQHLVGVVVHGDILAKGQIAHQHFVAQVG